MPSSIVFAESVRCSKDTSVSRPGCTAPATCSVRSCCSIRATRKPAARQSPSASARSVPQAVLSPALGGIVIGQEVARALGVRAIFAERQDGTLTLRRGFTLSPGEKVLVVEDVVTTGGSTREAIEVARAAGAQVVAAAAIIDRSGGQQQIDVPFHALATVSLPTYAPESCPLCAAGQPIVKPGSRSCKL